MVFLVFGDVKFTGQDGFYDPN